MKKLILTAFGLMTLVIIWTSCSKSKSDSNNNSQVTLLTQATWKYDTSGIDITKDGTIDVADDIVEACFKDNTYQFKSDNTVILDEGATKCDDSDPQTATYSWSISGSNPAILSSNADSILATGLKILTLNSTQLKVYKDTTISGIPLWFVLSLKH